MMGESGYSLSDIATVTGGGNNRNGGFGGDWGAWIILFLLFGLFGRGGWGNDGGGSGNGGGYAQYIPYASGGCGCGCGCATRADLQNQAVITKLDGITYGISDATYALNNSITSGFHGVDSALCNLGYQTQAGFNQLSSQMAKCCCDIERGIDGVNFNIARGLCDLNNAMNTNTRDILESNNNNTRAILDFLTQDKISTLQAENQALRFQASQTAQNAFITANQEAQTAELIRRLGADCPQPSFLVNPPSPVTFPTNCCGQFTGYSNNNGCGCGCGNY